MDEVRTNTINTTNTTLPASGAGGLVEQLHEDAAAVRQLLAVQEERQALANEAEQARAVRQEMCRYLLDTGLAASRLPAPMQEHVRAQFEGQVFEPGELTQAIDEARALVSQLVGAGAVVGPRSARCTT